ncbi:hypothetical protein ACJ8B3_26935 [Klebsiella pneumoniae]
MAQKTSPCLTTVQPPPGAGGCFGDFLHNQTAGAEPICTTPRRQMTWHN